MWFFRSPTIVFGEDALLHLAELRGARAMIITDETVHRSRLLDPVMIQLEHAGMQISIFDEVEPEPTEGMMKIGANVMNDFGPDWIVAVGGGSVIDAAKGMWVLYENPNADLASISPLEPLTLRARARFVAIPTTAGTGSEATYAYVVTVVDDEGNARKMGVGHPECMPDYAIVDPVMTMSLPPQLTADTGLDALVQAIEGYSATWANEFTDGLNLVAIKTLFEFLPVAYLDGSDREARERVANAATMAGLGYINAMVGAAHSMAHAAGAVLGIPHGRGCGLFLPYVIEYSAHAGRPEEVHTRYADILRFLGEETMDEHAAGRVLADRVRALGRQLGQAPTLATVAGITREEFEEDLDELVDAAMGDTVLFTSPRQPGESELRSLFECAFEGRSPEF